MAASSSRLHASASSSSKLLASRKGKVKQIVGSTLRDLKGEGDSALVTNFESDETASEFANLHKEDGLMGGADDLSKSIAIEELFIFPLLSLLRGFKKSRRLAGWRCYQCKQCFELRRGRNQPCYCFFILSLAMVKQTIERLKDLVRVAGKQKLV